MASGRFTPEQQDAILACADLAGRAGARGFKIGYLHDDVPVEQAGWYAHAQYRGTRLTEDNQPGPVEAAEALARRLLTGAQCRCGRLAALSRDGAVAYTGTLINGQRWTPTDARKAGQCLWRRKGARWEPSCPPPSNRPTRRERRGGRRG